jgi:hypothetical protein
LRDEPYFFKKKNKYSFARWRTCYGVTVHVLDIIATQREREPQPRMLIQGMFLSSGDANGNIMLLMNTFTFHDYSVIIDDLKGSNQTMATIGLTVGIN